MRIAKGTYNECDTSAGKLCKLLKGWRRGSESNRRIKVLQTSPLPLGYRAILNNCNAAPGRNRSGKCDFQTIPWKPPWTTEIPGEPGGGAATWSGRRDLNPRPSPWQGDALPLSYSRIRPEAVYRSAHRRVNAGPYSSPRRYASTAANCPSMPKVVSTSSFTSRMGSKCCLILR
jgi:hypothetical protein